MHLSRHRADGGARWALDGRYLPDGFTLETLLSLPAEEVSGFFEDQSVGEAAEGDLLAPVEPSHEVWAAG